MAYIAKNGNETVYSHEVANLQNKDFHYSCKNSKCPAQLKIVAINSEYKRPYFSASGTKTQHLIDCPFKNSSSGINTHYDDSTFDLDSFINNLFFKAQRNPLTSDPDKDPVNYNQISSQKPIKNVTQLYYFAKQHSPGYKLGDKHIYKLLSDQRTRSKAFFSGKNIFFGNILAEVTFMKYNTQTLRITVKPRFNPNLQFHLDFEEVKTMNFILNKIFGSTEKTFVVFANWNRTTCKIHSSKQVAFPTIIE